MSARVDSDMIYLSGRSTGPDRKVRSMSVLTLTATRALCAELLVVRIAKAEAALRESLILSDLRPSLERWEAVNATGTTTVYVTAGSLRTSPDADALATLARSLGATDAQIAQCVKTSAVSPSVRERNARPTDR